MSEASHAAQGPPCGSPSELTPTPSRSWHRPGVRSHLSGPSLSYRELLLVGGFLVALSPIDQELGGAHMEVLELNSKGSNPCSAKRFRAC